MHNLHLSKTLRILIAEDDPDIWMPYEIVLEKRGHIVDIAQNGEECTEVYRTSLKNVIKHNMSTKDDYSSNYKYADFISKSSAHSDYHNEDALSSSSYSSLIFSPPSPYEAVV